MEKIVVVLTLSNPVPDGFDVEEGIREELLEGAEGGGPWGWGLIENGTCECAVTGVQVIV